MSSLHKILSILIALVMVLPIVCMLSMAVSLDPMVWSRAWQFRIPKLLISSVSLVGVVMIGTFLLGSFLAFLVERTDLPFRKIFKPLLVAPLITPCYIIAICYINFFGIKGLGEKLLHSIGFSVEVPNIYGFWGAAAILISGTYPYVYTIVSATLNRMDPRFSQVARCLGVKPWRRFLCITFPLLVPAFLAGAVLVAFYVFADFGVVSLLRYPTFVSTIYDQMNGRYDYSTASSLSVVLVVLTLILFIIQSFITNRHNYSSSNVQYFSKKLYALHGWKIPAVIFILFVLVVCLFLPLGILVYWFIHSLTASSEVNIWSTSFVELWRSGVNSLGLSALVATVAVTCSIPVAYWSVRQTRSNFSRIIVWIAQSGLALPGVLVALGLSIVFTKIAPGLNYSILSLTLAFLIHFYAQGFQMIQSSLRQIPIRFEEGARILGYSSFRAFWYVSRPLLSPAMVTAWILVFLSSMRELPASLLLRPAGFDPLTVKIWIAASEGFYEQSAAPALLIIVLSLPLVALIMRGQVSDGGCVC